MLNHWVWVFSPVCVSNNERTNTNEFQTQFTLENIVFGTKMCVGSASIHPSLSAFSFQVLVTHSISPRKNTIIRSKLSQHIIKNPNKNT